MNLDKYKVVILADSARGIYIPQHFAEACDRERWQYDAEAEKVLLAGPEHPYYWDTWESVLEFAEFRDEDGEVWTLYQDGDLFAIAALHEPDLWLCTDCFMLEESGDATYFDSVTDSPEAAAKLQDKVDGGLDALHAAHPKLVYAGEAWDEEFTHTACDSCATRLGGQRFGYRSVT